MKSRAAFLMFPVLALAILILFLNYREVDVYPNSIPAPDEERLNTMPPQWMPMTLDHPCETCGTCEHTLELTMCRLNLVAHDHDGWYRLFWAGDEVYYYKDSIHLAATLRNPTAGTPEGTWEIEGRYVPPAHDHACGAELISEFKLAYRLVLGETPPQLGDTFPRKFQGLSHHLDDDDRSRIVTLSWERTSESVSSAPCACPK